MQRAVVAAQAKKLAAESLAKEQAEKKRVLEETAAREAAAKEERRRAEQLRGLQENAAAAARDLTGKKEQVSLAQSSVDLLQARVKKLGCLCQEEQSQPLPGRPASPLCVLRSDVNGKPRVWTTKDARGCGADCSRWMRDTGYTDLCATRSERSQHQTEFNHATAGLEAARQAVSEAQALTERTAATLLAWKP